MANIYSNPTIRTTMTLTSLQSLYNESKEADTILTSKLTSNFTLKGMDEINSLVAAAMLQIEEFTNNGKEEGLVKSTASKALSILDAKNKWVGKWLGAKSEAIKTENLMQQTVTQIVSNLRKNIDSKREEVISLIEELAKIREAMLARLETYHYIDKEATAIVQSSEPNTRQLFDAMQLSTMTKSAIQKIQSDVSSTIEPLLASANVSVQQIQAILPSIEYDLQSKLSIKGFQQQLQDLNGMVKAAATLSTTVGSKIRTSVNETIYQSISLLSESGVDIKAIKQASEDEIKHQQKVQSLMQATAEKIKSDFTAMNEIQSNLLANKAKLNNHLISQYATIEATNEQI